MRDDSLCFINLLRDDFFEKEIFYLKRSTFWWWLGLWWAGPSRFEQIGVLISKTAADAVWFGSDLTGFNQVEPATEALEILMMSGSSRALSLSLLPLLLNHSPKRSGSWTSWRQSRAPSFPPEIPPSGRTPVFFLLLALVSRVNFCLS